MNNKIDTMKNVRTVRNKMTPYFVGIDDNPVWNMISKFLEEGINYDSLNHSNTYPPHNVISDNDGEHYKIELAVAGYPKESLDVTVEQNILTISGDKYSETFGANDPVDDKTMADSDSKYLYKGISSKSFIKKFRLNENTEINKVDLHNGILTVYLEKNIPEEKRPKSIPIE